MCGMYIINGVLGPEPRSSGGNTSSNPQISALIPRPALNGMERMWQRHGGNQNSHPPVLVRKPLCNQLIHYHISSRRVFGINRFQLRNFAVVAIECSFATVYRGSIMARIHRWSMMIYCSLQAEFMETKYNSHIHGYGISVFGKIVVNGVTSSLPEAYPPPPPPPPHTHTHTHTPPPPIPIQSCARAHRFVVVSSDRYVPVGCL